MFDGENVKIKFPFKKIFGLKKLLVQDRVQDKVELRKFLPKKIFLQKALKCHVWWRNYEKKFPFKKNFGLKKILVQDRVQDKVQDKVGKSLKMSCLKEKL